MTASCFSFGSLQGIYVQRWLWRSGLSFPFFTIEMDGKRQRSSLFMSVLSFSAVCRLAFTYMRAWKYLSREGITFIGGGRGAVYRYLDDARATMICCAWESGWRLE